MARVKSLFGRIAYFFDKLEDRVRRRLSHHPVVYALLGAVGIILIWNGVGDMAHELGIKGPLAFVMGVVILLVTGLLVSFFVGDSILISGFKNEKKLTEKTEAEIKSEHEIMQAIEQKLDHLEEDIHNLRDHR